MVRDNPISLWSIHFRWVAILGLSVNLNSILLTLSAVPLPLTRRTGDGGSCCVLGQKCAIRGVDVGGDRCAPLRHQSCEGRCPCWLSFPNAEPMGGRLLILFFPLLLPFWLFYQQIDRHGSYTEMLQQTLRITLPIRNEHPTEHLCNPYNRLYLPKLIVPVFQALCGSHHSIII